MNTYTEQDLREKAAASQSMADLMRALGYGRSNNTAKKLRREMASYGIDYSHFNPIAHLERRRKYPLVTKECSGCGATFETRKGHRKEQKFCSNVCANKNMSPETIEKRRLSVIASVAKRRIKRGKDLADKMAEASLVPVVAPVESSKSPYVKPSITRIPFDPPKIGYSKESLEVAVKYSFSYAGVLKLLRKKCGGGNLHHVKTRILHYGIDAKHFTGRGWMNSDPERGGEVLKVLASRRRPDSEVFTLRDRLDGEKVRNRFVRISPPTSCAICGLTEWRSAPISFDMDHINGNNYDNRLENLRWLCPNCHRQTPTFGSKRGLPMLKIERKCVDCGKDIARGSVRCSPCNMIFVRKDRVAAKQVPTCQS